MVFSLKLTVSGPPMWPCFPPLDFTCTGEHRSPVSVNHAVVFASKGLKFISAETQSHFFSSSPAAMSCPEWHQDSEVLSQTFILLFVEIKKAAWWNGIWPLRLNLCRFPSVQSWWPCSILHWSVPSQMKQASMPLSLLNKGTDRTNTVWFRWLWLHPVTSNVFFHVPFRS